MCYSVGDEFHGESIDPRDAEVDAPPSGDDLGEEEPEEEQQRNRRARFPRENAKKFKITAKMKSQNWQK